MQSNYLFFDLQGGSKTVFIKPGEIISMSEGSDNGSRLVTRQNQVYYVKQDVLEVDQMIKRFFIELKEGL